MFFSFKALFHILSFGDIILSNLNINWLKVYISNLSKYNHQIHSSKHCRSWYNITATGSFWQNPLCTSLHKNVYTDQIFQNLKVFPPKVKIANTNKDLKAIWFKIKTQVNKLKHKVVISKYNVELLWVENKWALEKKILNGSQVSGCI